MPLFWSHYLLHKEFILCYDHEYLSFEFSTKDQSHTCRLEWVFTSLSTLT